MRLTINSLLPILLTLCLFVTSSAHGADSLARVYYIDNSLPTGSIPADPVKEFPQPSTPPSGADQAGTITLNPSVQYQKMVGVGAAFSEIGTLALLSLAPDQQAAIVKHLFSVQDGAGFQMCRLPVGSSDFATSAYSYDETPQDYLMAHFSVARDEKSLIPVVQQALQANPSLKLFASPWSPPGWMKISGRMDKGGKDSQLMDEEQIYQAYTLYFQKYLQSYQAHGIMISRLCPQNEMDANPGYPGCVIPPAQMIKLVGHYLAPGFKSAGITTEIWPGTFRERPAAPWAATCLLDESFRAAAVGLGVQYCNGKNITELGQKYPGLKFMYTEAPCDGGKNTESEARSRLGNMLSAFSYGCDSYAYWNMILDENQKSGWGWSQNSLITLDKTTKTVRYNADYQPMFLVSKFLRPNDVRIDSTYKNGHARLHDNMAFLQPDGTYLLLAQNQTQVLNQIEIGLNGNNLSVTLPAHADCAVILSLP